VVRGCSKEGQKNDNKTGGRGCSKEGQKHDNKTGGRGCTMEGQKHDNKTGGRGVVSRDRSTTTERVTTIIGTTRILAISIGNIVSHKT